MPLFQSWRQSFEVQKNKLASFAPQIESWCVATFRKALEYIRENCKVRLREIPFFNRKKTSVTLESGIPHSHFRSVSSQLAAVRDTEIS